jgi:hypothetical protein
MTANIGDVLKALFDLESDTNEAITLVRNTQNKCADIQNLVCIVNELPAVSSRIAVVNVYMDSSMQELATILEVVRRAQDAILGLNNA